MLTWLEVRKNLKEYFNGDNRITNLEKLIDKDIYKTLFDALGKFQFISEIVKIVKEIIEKWKDKPIKSIAEEDKKQYIELLFKLEKHHLINIADLPNFPECLRNYIFPDKYKKLKQINEKFSKIEIEEPKSYLIQGKVPEKPFKIKLAYKIGAKLYWRFIKGGGPLGNIHNRFTCKNAVEFDDDKNEIANFFAVEILEVIEDILVQNIKDGNVSPKYKYYEVPSLNIAQKKGMDGVLELPIGSWEAVPWNTHFGLSGSVKVFVSGSFYAKYDKKQYWIKSIYITLTWIDDINARSDQKPVEDLYKKTIECFLNPQYRVKIKSIYEQKEEKILRYLKLDSFENKNKSKISLF